MYARLYRTSDRSIGNQFAITRRFMLVRFARFTLHIRFASLSTVEG